MRYFFCITAFAIAAMSAAMYFMTGETADRLDFSVWSATCLIMGYLECRK